MSLICLSSSIFSKRACSSFISITVGFLGLSGSIDGNCPKMNYFGDAGLCCIGGNCPKMNYSGDLRLSYCFRGCMGGNWPKMYCFCSS